MDLAKQLSELKLGDRYDRHSRGSYQRYTRVPGGWIWQQRSQQHDLVGNNVFIPYIVIQG